MLYADVILPVPLADSYTYSVPDALAEQVGRGTLVRVEFGRKILTGIVLDLHPQADCDIGTVKPVIEVETSSPVVSPLQLRFWQWISNYYLCRLGMVFQAAFPTGLQDRQSDSKPKRKRKSKTAETETQTLPLNPLNALQQTALQQIKLSLAEKDICLLHGVTASGKTEIYCHLIDECLNQSKQVLYLLPEIALTEHLTSRLRRHFGQRLAVYHSKIGLAERSALWTRLLTTDEPILALGARSAVFLPFRRLGLIIVDEEHEPAFKQQEPAPRYNARNAAFVLAAMHGAKSVAGSATPSLESWYNAQTGKYGYVALDKRFEDTDPPTILPVDVKELRRKKIMKSLFSPLLVEKMQANLNQGGQTLLFQNRRGFAPTLVCRMCDWTPRCRFCDVSLTFHKQAGKLSCHYCGRSYTTPKACPDCGSEDLRAQGFGTEKVEEELVALFPDARIARMDSDTTRSRNATDEIISRFESGETQFLIGTQMISKGLDFERVALAGILSADALMCQPDFRASERAFQLIEQLVGRTGRRKTRGEVVLQTSRPDDPLIQAAIAHDYCAMAEMQLEERRLFRYPPYFRIILIDLRHRKEEVVRHAADQFAALLRNSFGDRIAGPDRPPVGRQHNLFVRRIMLKTETEASPAKIRKIIAEAEKSVLAQTEYRYISVVYDVDPL